MPIPVPFPFVPETPRPVGSAAALTVSRDGDALPLTLANGWAILPGVEGLDDPARAIIEVEPATWDGSLVTGSRYLARDVFVPLHYAAGSTEDLRATLRGLAVLVDVKRGPVTLEVAHADGSRRFIDGLLSAPFGTDLSAGEGRGLWRRLGLRLRCPDPLWYGVERKWSFTLGGGTAGFLSDTFLPVHVNDSQVTGSVSVVNEGDAEAFPVWTLTGPLVDATITLGGTSFTVPGGLTDVETLTIDARRGFQSVDVNGVPAWDRLSPGAQLSAVDPGASTLTVAITGATAATVLTASWRERWLTAW